MSVGCNRKQDMADALRLAGVRRSCLRAVARRRSQRSPSPRRKQLARGARCGEGRSEPPRRAFAHWACVRPRRRLRAPACTCVHAFASDCDACACVHASCASVALSADPARLSQ